MPSKDAALFVGKLLGEFQADFDQAQRSQATSFFDRGLPDLIAYALRFGVDPVEVESAARARRYAAPVFVLPPWKKIFRQDELRRGTYLQYEEFHLGIVSAYRALGYRLLEVPKASVLERVWVRLWDVASPRKVFIPS